MSSEISKNIRLRQLEKNIAILTDEQKKTWQDLVGATFTLQPGLK